MVLHLSELTKLSNDGHAIYNLTSVLHLSELTKLSNQARELPGVVEVLHLSELTKLSNLSMVLREQDVGFTSF